MKKNLLITLLLLVLLGLISISCTGCLSWLFPEPNNPPVVTSASITTATVGLSYTYDVNATDPDGDTLTYSLTISPTGMTINSSTGLISWTPISAQIGDNNVTVEVSDGKLTDTQTFTITVGSEATDPTGGSEVTTSRRAVMWELFVGPACNRCASIMGDVITLRKEYGYDELVILEEYGWDYGDYTGWGIADVISRYIDYSYYIGSNEGGFPAAYFNGVNQFVYYGDRGYTNYKAAIEAEIDKPFIVSITAGYSVSGRTVTINGNITNVSADALNNLVVEAMVYENDVYSEKWEKNVDHVVRDIITYKESGQTIDSLSAEESYEFSLTSSNLSKVHDMSNIHVVVYVQLPNSPTKEIIQALYIE
ncbi:hypothetical protein CVT91_06565 [Candidatus Atribacteria bacterium HGW-Atribacteria-1]|nr:MAG: hypothetical protein CVT91_06565 [Candidatus Atribacteria bacterium HGW-Atribacteria-1]